MATRVISKKEDKIRSRISSTASANKKRKHVLLNQPRLKKAQELLGTKTESETIERALERVITDAQRNKDVWAAQKRFIKDLVKEDAEIVDVFGRLER